MKKNILARYLKSKPWHWYLAVVITLIAGFLRFYKIPETVMFLGDQGRDALIVANIFKELDPVLIGPVTSVGNMYLGPLYYYIMLPFLWLSYPSPLGPVYAVAFFSTLTVFIAYLVGRKMFSPITGLLAAFFIAFSASAVDLSRFSWNPNLAPLFSLLMIFFNWKALRQPKYWILVALLFSGIIQLHYLTLLTGISAGTLWILAALRAKKNNQFRDLLKISLVSGLIILLSFIPLVLFDLRHGGVNSQAIQNMFTKEQIFTDKQSQSLNDKMVTFLKDSKSRAASIVVKLNLGSDTNLEILIMGFVLLSFLYLLIGEKKIKKEIKDSQVTIFFYLIIGIIGTAAYQHSLFTHYIAYLIPVTCILYALSLRLIIKKLKIYSLPLVIIILIGFIFFNYSRWPLNSNYLYLNTKKISEQIYSHLQPTDRYEIVLLSETRDLYGQSYRYFLSTTNNPPVVRDKDEIPDTLVIIDEEKKVEDVTQLPIYEIQIFPEKKIDQKIINDNLANIYIIRADKKHE